MTRADLAKYLGVKWATVRQWETLKRPVPWSKLRQLVISKHVTWDWLLEGSKPQKWTMSQLRAKDFDKVGINIRFLEYFNGNTKAEIAKELGVTHSAVSSWFSYRRQVPWDKLRQLVVARKTTWEWLIDGQKSEEQT